MMSGKDHGRMNEDSRGDKHLKEISGILYYIPDMDDEREEINSNGIAYCMYCISFGDMSIILSERYAGQPPHSSILSPETAHNSNMGP
jgi:hypothetical protein